MPTTSIAVQSHQLQTVLFPKPAYQNNPPNTTPQSHCHVYTSHRRRQTDRQAGSLANVLAGGYTCWRPVFCHCLCVSHLPFSFLFFKSLLSLPACLLENQTDTRVPLTDSDTHTHTAFQKDDLILSGWLAETHKYTHTQTTQSVI